MFQGGGNIPLILPVAARLVAQGHRVRVLAGPGIRASRLPVSASLRERVLATGATLTILDAPVPHPLDAAPPVRGVLRGWIPHGYVGELALARITLWSPAWAGQARQELQRMPVDVLAADFDLPGALVAAEATGTPAAALVHHVPWRPLSGVPPRGPGFLPARGPRDTLRDILGNAVLARINARDATPAHNWARRHFGLRPLRTWFNQYDAAARVLVLSSRAFDFPAHRLAANVRYVGTPIDDSGVPPTAWNSPWPADDRRPLVLVSLSTLAQGQAPVLQRILGALASLPVRGLVTLGPSLDPTQFAAPPNAVLVPFAPHAAVLPHTAAVVTQCGLGTLTKALVHGVPLVCIPLVGDQSDNAAQVVARGAGVRLTRDAAPEQVRAAIARVLAEPRFRARAASVARVLAAEDGTERAAQELELLGGMRPSSTEVDPTR